jgi:hypothetical protein
VPADEGTTLITTGLAFVKSTGFVVNMPFFLTVLSGAHRMAAQPQLALGDLADAQRLAEQTHEL